MNLNRINRISKNCQNNCSNFGSISPGKLSKSLEKKIVSLFQATNFEEKKNEQEIEQKRQGNFSEKRINYINEPLEHMWKEIFTFFSY